MEDGILENNKATKGRRYKRGTWTKLVQDMRKKNLKKFKIGVK